jgi:hypothetical protein
MWFVARAPFVTLVPRREIPTNYDVVATHRVNVYSIGGMPDLW